MNRPGLSRSAGAALLLALAATGCMSASGPRKGEPLSPPEGKALVFGRFAVVNNGRPVPPPGASAVDLLFAGRTPEVKLSLFRVESGRKAPYVRIDDGGDFHWFLPPGTYLLFHTPPGTIPRNEPLAAFQVAPGDRALCVGVLLLETSTALNESGTPVEYGVENVSAATEWEEAEARIRARHPGFALPVVRRALIVDGALLGLFDHYTRARCEAILARHGLRTLP